MRHKSRSKRRHQPQRFAAPKTIEDFSGKSEEFQIQWNTVAHVISEMRASGASLTRTASKYAIDRRTVLRLGKAALRKSTNGRYAAKRKDSLLRVLEFTTAHGEELVAVNDSREASRVARYAEAVKRFLQTGDSSGIAKFQGQTVRTTDGAQTPFLTELAVLRRLGRAGEFRFEDLYGRTA
jgi:hypothetical protein